ncbi:MAG TPA: 4-hydroxy-tetrahydrodipicolinate reductase [Bacteroidaceae bacterium]|nr:4-hydroxy-tetrahydrodipicolinate reductase [Bacteroidaceae bacterium]
MKIALIGYGKMGREIEKVALLRGHEIVCKIDVNNLSDFESDAFRSADVAIEFTIPSQAYNNVIRAFKNGLKVVSGSTGWMEQHTEEMRLLCEKNNKTLFWSSNFSLGVAIFSMVNSYLAEIMNNYPMFQISMSETHHIHKLDSPSGTAITLAQDIIKCIDRKINWSQGSLHTTNGIQEPIKQIPESNIRIDSIRKGEIPGIHTIMYESEADFITITHEAKNRSGLAFGTVIAAEYTYNHQGFLTMKDLMGFLSEQHT